MKIKIFFILFLFLSSMPASAGGPFHTDGVNNTGVPPRWKNGIVPWKVDSGDMSLLIKHADALSENGWVKPLFNAWEKVTLNLGTGAAVTTADVKFLFQGEVGEDVTPLNIEKYLKCNLDLQAPTYALVIFDIDGKILQYLQTECGQAIDPDKTIGLSSGFVDANGQWITGGVIIINGRMKDGIDKTTADPNNYEITDDKMLKAAVLHEIGHVLNLDHAQVNKSAEESCWKDKNCTSAALIPTMYPQSLTPLQYTPHVDDKVTLSWLYPTADFLQQFCLIHGRLKDVKGHGVPGVNVVARNASDPNIDARSMVSGVLYTVGTHQDGSTDGQYFLYGLSPGEEYQVSYESLSTGPVNGPFTGASGFGPLDTPPTIDAGSIPGKGGSATVKCDTGGATIEMPDVTLQLEVKATGIVPVAPGAAAPPAAPKKLSCALSPQSGPIGFAWLTLLLPILLVWKYQIRNSKC